MAEKESIHILFSMGMEGTLTVDTSWGLFQPLTMTLFLVL